MEKCSELNEVEYDVYGCLIGVDSQQINKLLLGWQFMLIDFECQPSKDTLIAAVECLTFSAVDLPKALNNHFLEQKIPILMFLHDSDNLTHKEGELIAHFQYLFIGLVVVEVVNLIVEHLAGRCLLEDAHQDVLPVGMQQQLG